MVTKEFAEAAAQINEILSYLPKEKVEKVPVKLRNLFANVASKDYSSTINPNKTLLEQDLYPKTKDLITIIYREYWCSEEERAKLDNILIENDKKYEEELLRKYNPDDIFKNNQNKALEENTEETALVVKKETFYHKLVAFIRKLFKKY